MGQKRHKHETQPHHLEEFLVVDEYLVQEPEGVHHEHVAHHSGDCDDWPRGWWITVYRLYCCCSECGQPIMQHVNIEAKSVVFCEGSPGIVYKWDHAPRERMTDSEADFLDGLEEEYEGLKED